MNFTTWTDEYTYVVTLCTGILGLLQNGKWCVMTTGGRELLREIDAVLPLNDGLVGVRKDGKWGIVNASSAAELAPGEGTAGAYADGGAVNAPGAAGISMEFDDMESLSPTLTRIQKDGKWGALNAAGKQIVPCAYEMVSSLRPMDDACLVTLGNKIGLIDGQGNEVIPCQWDFITFLYDGYLMAGLARKIALIERSGKQLTAC